MFGRQRGRWARSGLTLIELVAALAVVGVLGCLVLSRRGVAPAVAGMPTVAEAQLPNCPVPEPEAAPDELSLQETLDRMGYTVNVPPSFKGHSLDPRSYRRSTLDDTLDAGWFRSDGPVSMQLISQQTDLDASTRLVAEEPFGREVSAFEPVVGCGFNETPHLLTWASDAAVRFRLDFPPDGDRSTSLYSTSGDNESAAVPLMVLPARKNGVWVHQNEGSGYWAGAEETGDYLLCWEDRSGRWDGDFQDLVFVARGIKPSIGPIAPCGMARLRP